MAHYAFIDDDNIVVEVITGRDETDRVEGVSDWETYYASKRDGLRCLRTSFNTWANQHAEGGIPFRGNFAGIGFTYDAVNDVFVPPQPFPSWTLNELTWQYEPPVARPAGGIWTWDEETGAWING